MNRPSEVTLEELEQGSVDAYHSVKAWHLEEIERTALAYELGVGTRQAALNARVQYSLFMLLNYNIPDAKDR